MASHSFTQGNMSLWRFQMHAATIVLNDAAKHGGDHHGTVNRIEIRLKTRHHDTPASRLFIEQAIEFGPIFDFASSVAKMMVAELTVVMLQTSPNCSYRHLLSCKRTYS